MRSYTRRTYKRNSRGSLLGSTMCRSFRARFKARGILCGEGRDYKGDCGWCGQVHPGSTIRRDGVQGEKTHAPASLGHSLPGSLCDNSDGRAVAAVYHRRSRSAEFPEAAVADRRYNSHLGGEGSQTTGGCGLARFATPPLLPPPKACGRQQSCPRSSAGQYRSGTFPWSTFRVLESWK